MTQSTAFLFCESALERCRRDGIVAEEEHKLIGGLSRAEREQFELRPGDLLACRFNGNRDFVGRLSLYVAYLGSVSK